MSIKIGTCKSYSPKRVTSPNGSTFDYVYQYKDHLGNIRLSYSDANNNGTIEVTSDPLTTEIIEENNYYPFGLQHKGYNEGVLSTGNSAGLKWKYQGQELVQDLEFNNYEFKWRMHDPSIGRFMQIDPLAENYVYNGTYNFSENRVVDGVELEGLEHVTVTKYDVLKTDVDM